MVVGIVFAARNHGRPAPRRASPADSLSDVGNMYRATLGLIPRSPFYWQGRFTSAPGNWQDHINGLNTTADVRSINRAVGGEGEGYPPLGRTRAAPCSVPSLRLLCVQAPRHAARRRGQ